jgi:tetratricopeptide (TPR) repeat protein
MKPAALALLLAALALPGRAATPSRESIEKLFSLMELEKANAAEIVQANQLTAAASAQVLRGVPSSPEEQRALEAYRAKLLALTQAELGWPALKDLYAQVYAESFTQDEIDGLIAFYGSPAGRALAEKQPQLLQTVNRDLQQQIAPIAMKLQASALAALQDYESEKSSNAIQRLNRAIALNPNDSSGYRLRGDAESQNGDYDAAIADYNRAIALNPQSDASYAGRGGAKGGKNDLPGAIADYSRALELNPSNLDAWNGRGDAESSRLDFKAAIADYNRAIALNPRSEQAYVGRGEAEDGIRDYDAAIADLNRALALNPANLDAWAGRAETKCDEMDYDGALADDDRALAIDPHDAEACAGRGNALEMKGDYPGARAEFNRAIALDPKSSTGFLLRGSAESHEGRFGAAIADFDRVVKLDPGWAETYHLRGMAKEMKGDFAGAAMDYQKTLAMFPHEDYARFGWLLILRRQKADERPAGVPAAVSGWPDEWTRTIGQFLTGGLTESDLLARAAAVNGARGRQYQCEAFYYAGMAHLLGGDPAAARASFEQCLATQAVGVDEFNLAQVELSRLKSAPGARSP